MLAVYSVRSIRGRSIVADSTDRHFE